MKFQTSIIFAIMFSSFFMSLSTGALASSSSTTLTATNNAATAIVTATGPTRQNLRGLGKSGGDGDGICSNYSNNRARAICVSHCIRHEELNERDQILFKITTGESNLPCVGVVESLPTSSPSTPPTTSPTLSPTTSPTLSPTVSPTTSSPTSTPTLVPTESPTNSPTESPTYRDDYIEELCQQAKSDAKSDCNDRNNAANNSDEDGYDCVEYGNEAYDDCIDDWYSSD